VGAGGTSRAILERTAPEGKLLAIDQDESALEKAKDDSLRLFTACICALDFREVSAGGSRARIFGMRWMLADIGIRR